MTALKKTSHIFLLENTLFIGQMFRMISTDLFLLTLLFDPERIEFTLHFFWQKKKEKVLIFSICEFCFGFHCRVETLFDHQFLPKNAVFSKNLCAKSD
jgi:hypothetical protein